MGILKTLDRSLGDKSIAWDRGKSDEVESARQSFEYLVREKKYKAYKIDASKTDRKGEEVRFFDPTAEELLLVPSLVGG
jgi:hypothetical protein